MSLLVRPDRSEDASRPTSDVKFLDG